MPVPAIIGVTRFSVDPLSIIQQSLTEDEMHRRRTAVYVPARLTSRLALFRAFALPSLRSAAMRHPNFIHLIAYSSGLPPDIRASLHEISRPHRPWLQLLEVHPQEKFVDKVRDTVMAIAGGQVAFNFRIDDDDAISPDFVDAVVLASTSAPEGTVLSFDLGCYVQRIADDRFTVYDFDYPKIAIGLGVFCGATSSECVFDLPVHTKIPAERIVHIRDQNYWIRTLHSHNDSGTRSASVQPVDGNNAVALLRPRFGHLSIADALRSLSIATEERRAEIASKILFHIQ
ncbi:TPA: hypothetical protein U2Q01_000640 [Burkholderia multivorans]|uniref:glycosyltransferase n=1 Tax=Burkholderia multivorans TaxID=87883 RepID=UPI001B97F6DA|nr:glycosyltransferase [Burkholderia multivorans]MBR7899229.1 hypothetical protein [Burkholderia multivorans]MBU9221310.1 putative rhamnosyl transferase [Burkholderia multivorans]MDN8011716.1 glycosyltransferase [Burkholderia multivorans]HEM8494225.1 hypothetical protein [Burkholderia multivorans]